MADDDNDDERGKNDNTGKDHKPDHAQNNENAPRGELGTNRITGPSLGMGGARQARTNIGAAAQTQETGEHSQQPAQDQGPDKTKPYAIATGDADQDKELAKDHTVVSREEAEAMLGKDTVAQKFFDEPSQDSDKTPETKDQDQKPDRAAWEQQQAEKIAFNRQQSREKDRGHGY